MKKTEFISAGAINAVSFDDLYEFQKQNRRFPTKLIINYGEAIDQIGFCYDHVCFPLNGDRPGGSTAEFNLEPDEHIIKITGLKGHYWNNEFIFSLKFHTDKGRVLGIDNKNSQIPYTKPFEINFEKDHALACIFREIAPPQDFGEWHTDHKLLSGIGAYQIKKA